MGGRVVNIVAGVLICFFPPMALTQNMHIFRHGWRAVGILAFLILSVVGFISIPVVATADDHGTVRVYKFNNKSQPIRQKWANKIPAEKCYTLRKPKAIFRFSQTGYWFCEVFSSPGCEPGNAMTAMWDGGSYRIEGLEIDTDQPQKKFYRGTKWILHPSENVSIQSVRCQYQP